MKKNILVIAILLAIVAYGCSQATYEQTSQNQAMHEATGNSDVLSAAVTVDIQGYKFSPATITIKKGTTVTWTNQDSAPHTVTSTSGSELASDTLSKGGAYSHTFDKAGTFDYHCTVHPNMKAKVIVE